MSPGESKHAEEQLGIVLPILKKLISTWNAKNSLEEHQYQLLVKAENQLWQIHHSIGKR